MSVLRSQVAPSVSTCCKRVLSPNSSASSSPAAQRPCRDQWGHVAPRQRSGVLRVLVTQCPSSSSSISGGGDPVCFGTLELPLSIPARNGLTSGGLCWAQAWMTSMIAKVGQGVVASVLLLLPRGWCHFRPLPFRRLMVSCLAPRPGALQHSRSARASARQLRDST
jgi:hypothetical protein